MCTFSCSEEVNIDYCIGVSCLPGFMCENGSCIEDPNADPCVFINCPQGFECVDGNCIDTSIEIVVVSGLITSNTSWTSEKIYELAGKVIVDNGATLTIEAGTIIKGRAGSGSLATALIIARGSQLIAQGMSNKPIIFTTVEDNIMPGMTSGTNLDQSNDQLWGGLIVLGNAPVSAANGDVEAQVEGIVGDEAYSRYGGSDPLDNSGILNYISIRHSGSLLGENNEINGLTLGGVGSGTTIENIEVFATLDDGIQLFGGTVNIENAIVSYQGDDGIDIDQNYAGTLNNFMVIHGGSSTDNGVEVDGPEGSTHIDGQFTLSNGTLIALDQVVTRGGEFKSNAQGLVLNCSWRGYSKFLDIRASFDPNNGCTPISDAYLNSEAGTLMFLENEIESSTASIDDFATVYSDDDPGEEDCFLLVESAYQSSIDMIIGSDQNEVVSTASGGADSSVFGWTIASANGVIR